MIESPYMNRFWSPIVERLNPYVPGEQPGLANLIKLNTNENPFGPSPLVLTALREELGDSLRLYPDPNADELRTAIAEYFQLKKQQVFVGNGSDEVLAHAFHGLLKHERPLLFPDITYSFYPVYCGLYDIKYEQVPLTEAMQIRLEDYDRSNGGIIFPNPNAPTGCALAREAIETLLRKNRDSVVVVDEAYIDFGGETAAPLVDRYPNLLVVQTLSKSRSLAGLRVGFALGDPALLEALTRIKDSFNSYPLGRLALKGAMAALRDRAHFEQTTAAIIRLREELAEALCRLDFEVLPSKANFVFARHARHDAENISRGLREAGIVVRHFSQKRISQFLRITVGTGSQCKTLVETLARILPDL